MDGGGAGVAIFRDIGDGSRMADSSFVAGRLLPFYPISTNPFRHVYYRYKVAI